MANITATLCLIENFGCTRSADNTISFHCFIENCVFETQNLGTLLEHFPEEKWLGFCHTCEDQIYNKRVPLLLEVQHWDRCHRDEIGTSVVFQSYNKQSKLQEAVYMAKAKCLDDGVDDRTDGPISLKPWNHKPTLKSEVNCKNMLRKKCMYALHKCMDSNCAFTTSSDQSMLIHLEHHENSAVSADDAVVRPSWLECAYCDLLSTTRSSLVEHVREVHGTSSYQCPYCFYRSCIAWNVVYHLNMFHESRINSILVCPGKTPVPVDRTTIEEGQSKYVYPLRCLDNCNQTTYRMDHFMDHLKTAHDNHFRCQFCGLGIEISKAIQHLVAHNIGVYQCIYCLYGANNVDNIHDHMCHTHPTRLPYICVRLTHKNQTPQDGELSPVGSTLMSLLSQEVYPKLLKMCPHFHEEWLNNPRRPTVVESNPSLDIPESLRLSYDELKRDYSPDDWNEYFTSNRWKSLSPSSGNTSQRKSESDEGFGDETTSQMDISEPDILVEEVLDANLLDVSPMAHIAKRRKITNGYSVVSSSDAAGSQLKRSRKNIKFMSPSDQFTKIIEPKLCDAFRFICAYCPKPFMTPQLVYEHWKKMHLKANVAFMFRIAKVFKCCYCRYANIYDELKQHCDQKHSTETFAMIDKINQWECGLCSTKFSNASTELIVDHFKQHHNAIGTDTIKLESYLTDEWLEKVVAEKVIRRIKTPCNQIMYNCPSCPSARCSDQFEMVAHIRTHFLRFKCNCCAKTFEKIEMLQKHHANEHQNEAALNVVRANENLANYLDMRIIFPNGLVVTKRECVNTKFGAMDELAKMVQQLNGRKTKYRRPVTQKGEISQLESMITRSKEETTNGERNSMRASNPLTTTMKSDDQINRRKSPRHSTSVENMGLKKAARIA